MKSTDFKSIFMTTLRDPRQGGLEVIALNLPTQGLWIALMLMAVILSLLVSGLFQISPIPDDELGRMIRTSPAFSAPILFALINWGQSVVTVYVLHWVSRMVGGQGQVRDMLSVMIWLQIMTLALAMICVLVSIFIPPIGALFLLLAFFWGLWAIVAFVDAASGFNSLFKSLGVCIAGFLAFSFIMTIVASILAAFGIGGPPNV